MIINFRGKTSRRYRVLLKERVKRVNRDKTIAKKASSEKPARTSENKKSPLIFPE
jgi:hypothetical protein